MEPNLNTFVTAVVCTKSSKNLTSWDVNSEYGTMWSNQAKLLSFGKYN